VQVGRFHRIHFLRASIHSSAFLVASFVISETFTVASLIIFLIHLIRLFPDGLGAGELVGSGAGALVVTTGALVVAAGAFVVATGIFVVATGIFVVATGIFVVATGIFVVAAGAGGRVVGASVSGFFGGLVSVTAGAAVVAGGAVGAAVAGAEVLGPIFWAWLRATPTMRMMIAEIFMISLF